MSREDQINHRQAIHGANGLARRHLLALATPAFLFGAIHAGIAAPTGIEVLDNAAIPVKHPANVILIAITRAGDRLVAAGEHGVIIHSDDDGQSWTQASVPVDVTITSLAFATPSLGWAAGHFGVVLQTQDGGVTWHEQLNGIAANQLTMAAAQQAPSAEPNAPGTPFAMRRANFFMQAGPDKPFLSCVTLSPNNVIVFGAYRMTMITKDGGATWVDDSLLIGDALSHNLYAAKMIGADIFIAAEEGLVFRSSDGGATFPEVTSPAAVTLLGLTGTAGGHVIVFGVAGACWRSTDRGASWQAVTINVQDNLTAAARLPGGEIILASGSGTVFISHDDGVSFTAAAGVPPIAVAGMVVAADQSLVFAGQTGITRVQQGVIAS